MKHPIRILIDVVVDDQLYLSQGPVDQLADGSLDAPIVMAMRFRQACLNVEGIIFVDARAERLSTLK
jgi:hypothetical protein